MVRIGWFYRLSIKNEAYRSELKAFESSFVHNEFTDLFLNIDFEKIKRFSFVFFYLFYEKVGGRKSDFFSDIFEEGYGNFFVIKITVCFS